MSRIYELRKKQLATTIQVLANRSPILRLLGIDDLGDEWRCVIEFATKTLTELPTGEIVPDGPVIVGIRYLERFLSEAPHPFGVATILAPANICHPNVAKASQGLCLGHPPPGFSLEAVVHQIYAGLTLNLKVANTIPGDIANARAAAYVRENASRFPLTNKGLFESPDL